jgi:signal-transduction protein with cAMP-binding, CBS, and nucleotidyltransferase domain
MYDLILRLEVRFFEKNDIILDSLDCVEEFYFVQSGNYDIGFEINNTNKYRLQFGPRTVIGAFNVCF